MESFIESTHSSILMTWKASPSNFKTIKGGISRVQFIFLMAPIRLSNNPQREFHGLGTHSFDCVSAVPAPRPLTGPGDIWVACRNDLP